VKVNAPSFTSSPKSTSFRWWCFHLLLERTALDPLPVSERETGIKPNDEIDEALVFNSALIEGDHLTEIIMISDLASLEARDIEAWIDPTPGLVKFHRNSPWLIGNRHISLQLPNLDISQS